MAQKNAIQLLKEDHRKVKDLLSQLVDTTTRSEKTRRQLLDKMERELSIHTRLEEEIFYPAFRKAGNSDYLKLYFEALEEYRAAAELVLPDLKRTEPGSEKFSGRAKVLKELIEHHADEEEKDLFRKASRSMSKEELAELGLRMSERKQELLKERNGRQAAQPETAGRPLRRRSDLGVHLQSGTGRDPIGSATVAGGLAARLCERLTRP